MLCFTSSSFHRLLFKVKVEYWMSLNKYAFRNEFFYAIRTLWMVFAAWTPNTSESREFSIDFWCVGVLYMPQKNHIKINHVCFARSNGHEVRTLRSKRAMQSSHLVVLWLFTASCCHIRKGRCLDHHHIQCVDNSLDTIVCDHLALHGNFYQ